MFSKKKLRYNGFQAEELGFIVVEGAPEILAQEDYEVVTVEGRNGSLIINKGTYPDTEKVFTITAIDYMDNDDIDGMVDSIKKWLFDATDKRLYYAFSNKYNIVKKVIFTEDIKTSLEEFGDFQVTFLCEPFYYIDEETITIQATSDSDTEYILTNNGDFESYPLIRIHGTGDVTFKINGEDISVENAGGVVDIDSKLLTCLDYYGDNKSTDLLSDFPTLNRGDNQIIIPANSGISRIIITPRTIYR